MSGAPSNQNCPECGHPMSGHGLYGCSYGVDAEIAALRREAEAFRWLADGIARHDVDVACDYAIYENDKVECRSVTVSVISPKGWIEYQAPTLPEACEKAMAAEGETR